MHGEHLTLYTCSKEMDLTLIKPSEKSVFVCVVLVTLAVFFLTIPMLSTTVTQGHFNSTSLLTGVKRYLSNDATRNTSILCLILTTTSSQNKMAAVNKTWARRCDKLLFVYGESRKSQNADSSLYLPVPEGKKHLTGKMRHALEYVYRTYNDRFDWILKCDDDTYVIMENLRYLLSHVDAQMPAFLGFHMKTKKTQLRGYMSGGGGYVISSSALRQLIQRGFQNGSCRQDGGNEDEEIGLCLTKSDVQILRSQDILGRETFHPEPLQSYLQPPYPTWLNEYGWNSNIKFGSECCSKYSITFHHLTVESILLYEHLLYNTEVFGLRGHKHENIRAFNPEIERPAN